MVQLPNVVVRLFAACLLWTVSFTSMARGEPDQIVLGMSAAFTGPSRGLSIELYRGSMAYFNHVNENGGVHGRKISILPYDDGYDPVRAIENTVRLVEEDEVFLLFDYMGSPTVARMLPLLKRYRDQSVFLFFPFSGAEPQRQPPYGEFVFNLRTSYPHETAELVEQFVQLGRKRIAVFYQIDAYGRSGWDGVRSQLAKHDLQMVAEACYRRGTPYAESFESHIEILRKAKPDVIISVATYSAAAGFIRDCRNADWNVPIANVSGVDSENLLRLLLLESSKSGTRDYTKNLINSQVVPCYDDPLRQEQPAVRQYRELMDKYKPRPPANLLKEEYTDPAYSFISFEGYLNARMLVEILERMGPNPQRKDIRKFAESLDKFDLGIEVPVSLHLDSDGKHQGLDRVYFTVVSDGRFGVLDDWTKWRP